MERGGYLSEVALVEEAQVGVEGTGVENVAVAAGLVRLAEEDVVADGAALDPRLLRHQFGPFLGLSAQTENVFHSFSQSSYEMERQLPVCLVKIEWNETQ